MTFAAPRVAFQRRKAVCTCRLIRIPARPQAALMHVGRYQLTEIKSSVATHLHTSREMRQGEDKMSVRLLGALAALLALESGAIAQDFDSRRATFGKIIYDLSCTICHGASGHGDGEYADKMLVPAPDLTTLRRRNGGVFPTEDVTEIIIGGASVTTHGGQMPAWGLLFLKDFEDWTRDSPATDVTLVKRRVGDLVEYLKEIQVP